MGDFLTLASVLTCPHGGTVVATPASDRVSFGGDPAAVATGTFQIVGCPFPPTGTPHPCVTVDWTDPARHSAAGGGQTLTTDSTGDCLAGDQAIQGQVVIQATQTRAGGL
jgi:hypothetical protein